MKKLIKLLTIVVVLVAALCCLSACSTWKSEYLKLQEQGYDVTVRFDTTDGKVSGTAGTFIVDVYTTQGKEVNSDGKVEIKLYAPDSALRGLDSKGNPKMQITKDDHTLIGWYTHRELRFDENGNALDEYGQLVSETGRPQGYVYSGLWNFDKDTLKVDPNAKTEGDDITLYAAWAPRVTYDIYYEKEDGSFALHQSVEKLQLNLPSWNTSTGKMIANGFPVMENKTFNGASLTQDFSEILAGTVPGAVNLENGTLNLDGDSVKVYTKWLEGTWYRIETVKQFKDNANLNGNYMILADLDFKNTSLPTAFLRGAFEGKIIGNGHTFSNIKLTQDEASQQGGIFYEIGSNAHFENLSFTSLLYIMKKGATKNDNSFGLFAGKINDGASFDNVTISGELQISADINSTVSYSIGLLCGNQTSAVLDITNLTCTSIDNGGTVDLEVTVSDDEIGSVELKFIETVPEDENK